MIEINDVFIVECVFINSSIIVIGVHLFD